MTMTNLPAVPGHVAFKDRPGAVHVVTQGDVPPIISRMQRVHLADETIAAEQERYAANKATGLLDNELAADAGYRALAEGRVLIDLHETMARGHSSYVIGRMTLALAHPRMRSVFMRRFGTEEVFEFHTKDKMRNPFYTVVRGDGRRGDEKTFSDYEALAPPIPAEVRSQHPNLKDDDRYLLLWEAEWRLLREHSPRPPLLDPALLYQVAGGLYSVVAVWDLTPVEMSALRPGPTFS